MKRVTKIQLFKNITLKNSQLKFHQLSNTVIQKKT